jgi:shikimate dehydrogenase
MNDHSICERRVSLLLGLIGSGIQASLTPAMHEREAAEHGLQCLYQLIDLDPLGLQADALSELLAAAERMGFAGLNITHPCKQSVLPLLTDLSDDDRALGAVNTVVLREGRRWGHNTDWLAFSESFPRGLPGAAIRHIVQLGAGGAGAATAYAMLKMGAGHITVLDLDSGRSEVLGCAATPSSANTVSPPLPASQPRTA